MNFSFLRVFIFQQRICMCLWTKAEKEEKCKIWLTEEPIGYIIGLF